jgi:hypothetical protein
VPSRTASVVSFQIWKGRHRLSLLSERDDLFSRHMSTRPCLISPSSSLRSVVLFIQFKYRLDSLS